MWVETKRLHYVSRMLTMIHLHVGKQMKLPVILISIFTKWFSLENQGLLEGMSSRPAYNTPSTAAHLIHGIQMYR